MAQNPNSKASSRRQELANGAILAQEFAYKVPRQVNRALPDTASTILSRVLKRSGLERKLSQYEFVLQWSSLVGDEIASHAKPQSIVNGTFYVEVESSGWAQELSFQKQTILMRLRKVKAFETVRDIRFVVAGSVAKRKL